MTNTEELRKIVLKVPVKDKLSVSQFSNILEDKLNRFKLIIENKRFSQKFITDLDSDYCHDEVYISLMSSSNDAYGLKTLKSPYCTLYKDTLHAYEKQSLVNLSENSINNKIKTDSLFKLWTEDDLKDLILICNSFSNPLAASYYFFEIKMTEDGRLKKIADYANSSEQNLYNLIGVVEFHNFIKTQILRNNINCGFILKYDSIIKNSYVEYFHAIKYGLWNLYLPFSHKTLGWTHGTVPYKKNIINLKNKNDALESLRDYCNFIKAIPSVNELEEPTFTIKNTIEGFDKWLQVPSNDYWQKNFGELRFALIEAGIINSNNQNSKYGIYCIAKDGHQCRSMSEQIIDNYLFEHNILHTLEPLYPQDDELNPTGRLRADWLINGHIFVEFFGLMQNADYRIKALKKIQLAKKKEIELIEIYDINFLDMAFKKIIK